MDKANTPEKGVLAALKAILKFQLNTHLTLRTDSSSLKGVLDKFDFRELILAWTDL